MKYICNPINFQYRYQFIETHDGLVLCREAADPSIILFKGKYYIFLSMTKGILVSDDLCSWRFVPLKNIPAYDYAHDACVVGDYVYVCASNSRVSDFYRTKDPESDEFEVLKGPAPLGDPKLFCDDDGKLYMYYGGSNVSPIYGVELDPETLKMRHDPIPLIYHKIEEFGFERAGEDHFVTDEDKRQNEIKVRNFFAKLLQQSVDEVSMDDVFKLVDAKQKISFEATQKGIGFNEGAWMNKFNGKYYLQYACCGTEYNTYADAVYVSDLPLGPFKPAQNNPFSYSPGGFFPGAGHGSTIAEEDGNLWHLATMRISKNHIFERRIGIWPAGIDEAGELFCDQRYGDWPRKLSGGRQKLFEDPEWMLLSYGKKVTASSGRETVRYAVDEDVQTWWRAETNAAGEWIEVDLGGDYFVHAVQINFADFNDSVKLPDGKEIYRNGLIARYIDDNVQPTRWVLYYSLDGKQYTILEDKSEADTDLPHDLVVREQGFKARFIRLTIISVPYAQKPCISGLRVFGKGAGNPPEKVYDLVAQRMSHLDMLIKFKGNAIGYNILWGLHPDKLYHSYLVYGKNEQAIRALVKRKEYYVRVDAFNENGITHGDVVKVESYKG